jgi:hypothetical protein
MSDIKDNFIKSLDSTEDGIKARISTFDNYLSVLDNELFLYLEKEGVNPQFYALRWIILLLTQEFHLNDVLRLWDSLLSMPDMYFFKKTHLLAVSVCGLGVESKIDSLGVRFCPNHADFAESVGCGCVCHPSTSLTMVCN